MMTGNIKLLYIYILSNATGYLYIKNTPEGYQIMHDHNDDRRVITQDLFIYPAVRFGNSYTTKTPIVRRRPR